MLDYENLLKKEIQKNLQNTLPLLREGKLDEKIYNFSEEYGFTPEEVKESIENNRIVRAFFIKKPNRQGFHEKIAFDYIKKLPRIKNCQQLPKSRKDSLYLSQGDVIKGKKSGKIKSIDFYWEIEASKPVNKLIKCYATHKYTRTGGGHQDNQYKDVQEFINHSIQNSDKFVFFFAICDGAYYNTSNGTYGMLKIENLKRIARSNENSIVCTINDLQKELKKIRKEIISKI